MDAITARTATDPPPPPARAAAPSAAAAFTRGAVLTRGAIRVALGGSTRSAFPTSAGRVTCLCITREMNPGAPGEVLVPARPGPMRLARQLAADGGAVPVFVRRRPREWEAAGAWRVRALLEGPAAAGAAAAAGRTDVGVVLLLEEAPAAHADGGRATALSGTGGGAPAAPAAGG